MAAARRAFRGAAAGAVLLFAGTALAADPGFVTIDLTTRPIDNFLISGSESRFGGLEFRGGLELLSTRRDFGSLSGLDFAADGATIYAVADTGLWFTAKLVEKDGRLAGLAEARLAPILNGAGKPLTGKYRGDAEGLRIVQRQGGEAALVSFEEINDVRLFVAAPDLAHAKSRTVKLPASVTGLSPNKGLEAIAVAPVDGPLAGAIVLVAERSLDKNGDNRAWVVSGPRAGPFAVKRTNDFSETDAAFLPDGDLLVLERKFNIATGIAMRMRRIAVADIEPGAVVDGPVLLEADMRYQIDNMEGLAVKRGPNGETVILLVSDDNLSLLQRTLLLQFVLPAEAPPAKPAG